MIAALGLVAYASYLALTSKSSQIKGYAVWAVIILVAVAL